MSEHTGWLLLTFHAIFGWKALWMLEGLLHQMSVISAAAPRREFPQSRILLPQDENQPDQLPLKPPQPPHPGVIDNIWKTLHSGGRCNDGFCSKSFVFFPEGQTARTEKEHTMDGFRKRTLSRPEKAWSVNSLVMYWLPAYAACCLQLPGTTQAIGVKLKSHGGVDVFSCCLKSMGERKWCRWDFWLHSRKQNNIGK